ncbi:MAG: hypothetical protein ACETVU_06495 [Desulfatiglandales bacterium]
MRRKSEGWEKLTLKETSSTPILKNTFYQVIYLWKIYLLISIPAKMWDQDNNVKEAKESENHG